jgi:hypothetical protein
MLLQLELLCVAGLHHHEILGGFPQTSDMREDSRQRHSPVASTLLCTVCQTLRPATARIATRASAPKLAAPESLLLGFPSRVFHSYEPVVMFGRAPPLS